MDRPQKLTFNRLVQSSPYILTAFTKTLLNRPFAFSFDVADHCPINCNCYWRAQGRVHELSDEEVVNFFQKKRRRGYVHVTLIGGEPYVRRNLLTKLAGIIPAAWVVTSGVSPLLKLTQTVHFVSVDGADAPTHNQIRGKAGLFEIILKNLEKAKTQDNRPLYIHCVLNRLNYQQTEKILNLWQANQLANGVIFSTLTPIKESHDDGLRLNETQRDWIVSELSRLKPSFGDFLFMTENMIRDLSPQVTKDLSPEKCGTARFVESFDASGTRRKQCVLSEKADCRQCGCVITAITNNLTKFPPDLKTFSLITQAIEI